MPANNNKKSRTIRHNVSCSNCTTAAALINPCPFYWAFVIEASLKFLYKSCFSQVFLPTSTAILPARRPTFRRAKTSCSVYRLYGEAILDDFITVQRVDLILANALSNSPNAIKSIVHKMIYALKRFNAISILWPHFSVIRFHYYWVIYFCNVITT